MMNKKTYCICCEKQAKYILSAHLVDETVELAACDEHKHKVRAEQQRLLAKYQMKERIKNMDRFSPINF